MQQQLFSSSWYRVSGLRPQLRSHARIHRHVYRGKPFFVLEDLINQRVIRIRPATHAVIGLMDGRRTLSEIWEVATETFADEAPTQDEMIQLLGQLHSADILQCDVPPDTRELLERYETTSKKELRGRLLSPFAVKLPLWDPDSFLRRIEPWVRPVAGRIGIAVWLATVLPALVLAGLHWTELTEGVIDRLLAPQNLVLLWLIFPVIKIVHELAHGIACRLFGGEVHEMGVMLLVFTPIPYVDASSASAFPQRHQRALVASAGMIVEVFLAAVAFYVWNAAEAGAVRTVAYNAMLVAGITTLTFNANPLLRFDGYYILADLIEIPNLRQRSSQFLGYLFERYLFGSPDVEEPDADPTERVWLASYGVAAFFYRMFLIAFILFFVLDISLVLGTILAAVAAIGWIGMPLTKVVKHLLTHPRLHVVRGRAIGFTLGLLGMLVFVLVFLPLPYRTQVEGVVWVPEESWVRVETAGFVEEVNARPGQLVAPGDLLFTLRDSDLEAYAAVVEPRLRALQVRRQRAEREDRGEAQVLAEEIEHMSRRLRRAQERIEGLEVRSPIRGRFVAPDPGDLLGRYVEQGEALAQVLEIDTLRVRAVVTQADIALVLDRLEDVEVRLAERIADVVPAKLEFVVPAARSELPSVALGAEGGGALAIDPRAEGGAVAVQSLFEVELEVEPHSEAVTAGGRVYVRFDHGSASMASRWARSLRQLFLETLDV